jgi:molybdate transport system substrate-binding protein
MNPQVSAPIVLKGISSMATKTVLHQLTHLYHAKSGIQVEIESVGGVDAAKRVQSGEQFDIVLLASDAIEKLIKSGCLLTNSRQDWVNSNVAIAVKSGVNHPDVSSAASLKATILSSPSISYSTGPSGVYLEKLFESWAISDQVKALTVVAPPGVPVGSLVASGQVALGFQQLSELIALPGIDVLGTLPEEVAYTTHFSSGIPIALEKDPMRMLAVKGFVDFLNTPEVQSIKTAQGMEPI